MKNLIFFFLLFLFPIVSCQQGEETWEFNYPGDNFTSDALLDLRYLNESYAGEHGFISLSEDGESFVRGDGEKIRFWPVNGGNATQRMSDEELAFHARFLAKQGVNMNRWHGSINPSGKGTDIFEIDTAEIQAIWRFVAAMKKEGIYSTISPFWAHNGHMGGWVPEEWGIDGYSGKDDVWEVLYFHERMQEAYKRWVTYLYTEVNPYTGLALKDDPAVALIQIKNEDGVFFWTMQSIKPELKHLVGRMFASWLSDKYGSLNKAMEAWEGFSMPDDDLSKGVLDIAPTWDLLQDVDGPKALRLADQTEYMAYQQKLFYDTMHAHYRSIGCVQMINPNNWKTASPGKLNDLERYTYMGCEVPAVNRYCDPGHYGENNGWRIDPGHFYQGLSCLKNPLRLPVNVKQTAGAPFMITESGWNFPHRYMSESAVLVAAYQSLTGHDAYYWFSITSPAYNDFPYFDFTRDENGIYAMNRWTYSLPGGIAQSPAYALLFRKGYIAKGETMVHEVRSLASMWNREESLISEESSFDPNRDQIEGVKTESAFSKVNPYAFLTGPVVATYGGDPADTYVSEKLGDLIDLQNGIISSVTGELLLDSKNGIFTFQSPKAAGISGFLGEKKNFELADVSINTDNEYISIGLVSMDDEALSSSKRILVQTGTTYHPTDWEEVPDTYISRGDTLQGYRIINTGKMPWLAQATHVELIVNNPNLKKAILLDLAGYPVRELELKRKGGKLRVRLPAESLYVVLSD